MREFRQSCVQWQLLLSTSVDFERLRATARPDAASGRREAPQFLKKISAITKDESSRQQPSCRWFCSFISHFFLLRRPFLFFLLAAPADR